MISPGDDIADIIIHNLKTNKISIHNGDILTIAQKIISKSENRYRKLSNIKPTKKAKNVGDKISKDPRLVQAVLDESKKIVRYKKNVLIVEHKLGFIHANAGIDRSNIDQKNEQILLLPKDPDKSAKKIGQKLERYFQKDISIIISDTMGRPFRNGVVGFAIGSYNLECLRDEIGSFDLYGNDLKVTQIGIADELAASASLIMGQANEAMPLVIIRDFYKRRESKLNAQSLIRTEKEDLFR